MKRYAVVFEESAQADVRESYDWGCRVWGKRCRFHLSPLYSLTLALRLAYCLAVANLRLVPRAGEPAAFLSFQLG
jgi:hypothetical protein